MDTQESPSYPLDCMYCEEKMPTGVIFQLCKKCTKLDEKSLL